MTVPPAVSAGHPATAQAGAAILRRGGTAADAAVAMMLVSCAAESIFTGLSGGGFAIYYDAATRTTRCVDFFVAVPGLGGHQPGPSMPIEVSFVGQAVPYDIGAATVAVPGVPAGARHLWQRWGRLDWADVVAPGLKASRGTPFPPTHAALLPDVAAAMCVGEGSLVYQHHNGELLKTGDLLAHPDHERAYQLLASDPDSFYRGEFAEAMVAAVAGSGALSLDDLAAYQVIETDPAAVEVPGATIQARGNDLDNLLGTVLRAAETIEADPLTDPKSALALIDALRAPDRRAETTNLVAVDAEGNACCITTSLGLGSGTWVPGYGTHLNSMLGEGELIRGTLQPGVRMGSMMSPLIALDADSQLIVAAGAAGGSRIRPALVQTMIRILAGETPQRAIDAPRLNALPNTVRLEPGFAPHVLDALRTAGNEVHVASDRVAYFGGVSAISRTGAGADPRRSGQAVAV